MTHNIMIEVLNERANQDKKWGEQNHSPLEWLPILAEEFGEVSRAVCECYFGNYEFDNYREELIQIAAVAIAMVESLDRNRKDRWPY